MRADLVTNLKTPVKSVEAVPRKSYDIEELQRMGEILSDRASVVSAPDNPMGVPGIDPVISTYIITHDNDLIPMPHITPRDRNRLLIHSQVLTSLKFGIRNFFTISGDPIDSSVGSKEVREVDPSGMAAVLRSSYSYISSGNGEQKIALGSAINPYRENEESIVNSKLALGSDFFISQVLFEPEALTRDWIRKRNFRVLAGFMPITKKGQLEFVKRMGSRIPESVINRIENSNSLEETSSRIIKEVYDDLKGYVDGIHLMPLGRTKLAASILECL